MHSEPHDERFYQELRARIAALPAEEQPDAVFTLFDVGLKMMKREMVVALRADLARRFPQDGDARDLGTVLLEIVDGYLALCALGESAEPTGDASNPKN